mgnify:CR=1 FL=1
MYNNQLRIYLTDGSAFTFSGGSGALDDRVYISNVTITATRQSRFSVGEELHPLHYTEKFTLLQTINFR